MKRVGKRIVCEKKSSKCLCLRLKYQKECLWRLIKKVRLNSWFVFGFAFAISHNQKWNWSKRSETRTKEKNHSRFLLLFVDDTHTHTNANTKSDRENINLVYVFGVTTTSQHRLKMPNAKFVMAKHESNAQAKQTHTEFAQLIPIRLDFRFR